MGVLTALMLAFVLHVTPFDDNDGDRSVTSQFTTKTDKTQASALAATIAGCAAGFLCKVTEGRGAALDAIVGAYFKPSHPMIGLGGLLIHRCLQD